MGLFSKKENVPHIPPAIKLPELPKVSRETLPELPSFHTISSKDHDLGMPGADSSDTKEVMTRESPQAFHSERPLIPSKMYEDDFGKRRTLELSPPLIEKRTIAAEPVFVRIDKFQQAQKDFDNIKKQVKEIESILGKVKEKRIKEEAEISSWIEDLEKIKARLAEIDSDIFSKI